MKKKYTIRQGNKTVEREYSYIPVRYVIAAMISIFEVLMIIGVVIALCYYVPYFYIAAFITQVFCVVKIVSSDDNPDYKVPWLLFVLVIPVAGFMLYFLFYSRKLERKYIRRLGELDKFNYTYDDSDKLRELFELSPSAASHARMLREISGSRLFPAGDIRYFPSGDEMWDSMLSDLSCAESFIFLEYFIIEEGKFWNSILDILKKKAEAGVDVRVIYDDIGCMRTLPGNYAKQLRSYGIAATPFSRLRGNADSEFNNRNHRKILVIDGKIGYTGGVNIADEYVNETVRFGHWKDTGVRLEGEGVYELTRMFLYDFGLNVKRLPNIPQNAYPERKVLSTSGFVIPFGDGPAPLFTRRVSKGVIQNLLNSAFKYVHITTPYLIIDNALAESIENAALRGVDVRIIVPHIPDKKIVFGMTKSYYPRLMRAGVKIYEYTPGFIHAKSYIADGKYAMIGSVNLDYRSLVHHFECGVWMYECNIIETMECDFSDTLEKSTLITPDMIKPGLLRRMFRSLVKIFAPLM